MFEFLKSKKRKEKERLEKTEADSYARCVYQLEAAKNGGKK